MSRSIFDPLGCLTVQGRSTTDAEATEQTRVDPATGRLLVDAGSVVVDQPVAVDVEVPSAATYRAVVEMAPFPAPIAEFFSFRFGSAQRVILLRFVVALRFNSPFTNPSPVPGELPYNFGVRSTLNTGGTPTTGTSIGTVDGVAAASSSLVGYASNPITGTPVGDVQDGMIVVAGQSMPGATGATARSSVELDLSRWAAPFEYPSPYNIGFRCPAVASLGVGYTTYAWAEWLEVPS